ncbi:MAG TPA: GAF and ANTAR domain-containing protein [Euzebya sp.]|nr:GAF and ANTAR domain-containing protein [Euzebya sp.]
MSTDSADRQLLILKSFVEIADMLSTEYEVGELLQFLVDRTHQILDAGTVGVLLETPNGSLQLAAATSPEMELIERAEMDSGEGPCMEAYRTHRQVLAPDLRTDGDRWPKVSPRLLELGMLSGYGFPLKLRDDCIGALNVYRYEAGPFDKEDLQIGQSLADVAAIGILQQRRIVRAEDRAQNLHHALESRIIIEQAKGVVAAKAGITPMEAFEELRRYARSHHLRIHDLSQQVVDGTVPGKLS